MQDNTAKLTEEEMKQICAQTKSELMKFANHADAALATLETFLPKEMRITIIVRKSDDRVGVELAGAMMRTNDELKNIVDIIKPIAKALEQHPEQFR